MKKPVIKQGYIKLWRLGPISFTKQDRWKARVPENKGLWAFVYPYWESFLTYHKYKDMLPKELKDPVFEDSDERAVFNSEELYQKQRQWIKNVGMKNLPIREFWYKGYLYSHFDSSGKIGEVGIFEDNTEWNLIHSTKLAEFINKTGGDTAAEIVDGKISRYKTSVDHLEVFIGRNKGTIRSKI